MFLHKAFTLQSSAAALSWTVTRRVASTGMTMNGIRTLALVALLIPASLRAQNLVVNGGFETGDLTGVKRK